MTVLDIGFSVYEQGGLRAALNSPGFYEQIGGSVSSLSLGGIAAFYAGATTSEFGPWVAAPAAVVSGVVVGTVAYIGGRSTTQWLLRSIWPQFYQQFERQQIAIVSERLAKAIEDAQSLPER